MMQTLTQSLKEDTVRILFCFADFWTCLSEHSQGKEVELTNREKVWVKSFLSARNTSLSPPRLECNFLRAEVSHDYQKIVNCAIVYQC